MIKHRWRTKRAVDGMRLRGIPSSLSDRAIAVEEGGRWRLRAATGHAVRLVAEGR